MKRIGKMAVCLAGGLALTTSLRAAGFILPGNPYAPVVARNVFALNPPQVVAPTVAEPPVKITPNGIMSIFGHLQVLFKVAVPPQPGRPNGDQSYILMEGQRQDDIEVTKIDEKKGIVTFNNHGLVQELPLVVASASGPALPAPSFQNFGTPTPDGNNGGGFGNRFGGRGSYGGRRGLNNGGDNSNGSNNGSNLRSVPMRAGNSFQNTMTPEEQTVMIEANRLVTQDQVTRGELPPLPLTEMTPPDATGTGGQPLATPAQ